MPWSAVISGGRPRIRAAATMHMSNGSLIPRNVLSSCVSSYFNVENIVWKVEVYSIAVKETILPQETNAGLFQ